MITPCPVPGRWTLDELARELHAEGELNKARWALYHLERGVDVGAALDRYIVALEALNALRGGAP